MSRGGATRFTPERGRAIALAREARRREARRLAATFPAKAADGAEVRGSEVESSSQRPAACAPLAAEPLILGELVEGADGVLRPQERRSAPRTSPAPEPRSPYRPPSPDRQPAPVPAQVEAIPEPVEQAPASRRAWREVSISIGPGQVTTRVEVERSAVSVDQASEGGRVRCPCGKNWPSNEDAERRRQHWVERQPYPGETKSERKNRDRCLVFCGLAGSRAR
jgi:hypothetical protein